MSVRRGSVGWVSARAIARPSGLSLAPDQQAMDHYLAFAGGFPSLCQHQGEILAEFFALTGRAQDSSGMFGAFEWCDVGGCRGADISQSGLLQALLRIAPARPNPALELLGIAPE